MTYLSLAWGRPMLKPALSFAACCVSLIALSFVDVPKLGWLGSDGDPLGWTPNIDCPKCEGGFAVIKDQKYDPDGFYVCRQCGAETPADYGFEYVQTMREKATEQADAAGIPFEGFDSW